MKATVNLSETEIKAAIKGYYEEQGYPTGSVTLGTTPADRPGDSISYFGTIEIEVTPKPKVQVMDAPRAYQAK